MLLEETQKFNFSRINFTTLRFLEEKKHTDFNLKKYLLL